MCPARGLRSPSRQSGSVASQISSIHTDLQPNLGDGPLDAVVFACGASEDGQLGLDTREDVRTPKVVEGLLGTQFAACIPGRPALLAGSRTSLAIDAEGGVLAWGWNGRGTLGRGHRGGIDASQPQHVRGLEGVRVVQVALGGWHCLALDDEGQVYAWGGNEYGQCGVDTGLKDVVAAQPCLPGMRFRRVAAGGMHSLALTDAGELWTWGEAWGDFSMTVQRAPRRIDFGVRFVDAVCGAFHNLAISVAGEVYTWGINDFGQLGNGTTNYATVPERVEGLDGVRIAGVSAGGWHSLALSTSGEVYVWGRGEYGRLGLGDRSGSSRLRPCQVTGALEGQRVAQAACGGTHTLVMTQAGRAYVWGRAAFGRLGAQGDRDLLTPAEVGLPGGPGRWRVVAVAAGGRHSMILAVPERVSNSSVRGTPRGRSGTPATLQPQPQPTPSPAGSERWTGGAGEADDEATPNGGASPEDAASSPVASVGRRTPAGVSADDGVTDDQAAGALKDTLSENSSADCGAVSGGAAGPGPRNDDDEAAAPLNMEPSEEPGGPEPWVGGQPSQPLTDEETWAEDAEQALQEAEAGQEHTLAAALQHIL